MSKVVFFSTTFYPEMIEWNPLQVNMSPDWKEYERDWKALGRPISPLTGDPSWTQGQMVVTDKDVWKYAKSNGKNRNPYAGDWRRVGELGENFLYAAGRLVHCPLPFDRTDTWSIFNTLHNPIPSTDNWNMTFPEVCHKRAQELWGRTDDIRLWWSGGIDSTTSLTALTAAELNIPLAEPTNSFAILSASSLLVIFNNIVIDSPGDSVAFCGVNEYSQSYGIPFR